MHSIRIDRQRPLAHEPHLGHNRFHPDIAPIVEVGEGEEVALETRDALDGQIKPGTTVADFPSLDAGAIHPLTGPVFVKGAAQGDILEIEFTDIIAQPVAFSMIMPGLGFLRDVMTEPFLAHWQVRDGWATSAEIPGVRIPGGPFMGVSGVAPSAEKLFLPVFKEGGLFSTGDGHFAQGDGEVCVTAVEMGATAVVRFKVHKGLANRRKFTAPVFSRTSYFIDPRYAAPERFLGVMGMPINQEGEIEAENLTLACRNAVLNMMELLQERGFSRQQAYVICSVAVDLRISNVVDVPNYVVSALLPEAIFDSY